MSTKHLAFDDSATIAFGSITGTYANLLAMSDDADVILIFNTCDAAIYLSVPSGITNLKPPTVTYRNVRFPAKTSMAIDARTNSGRNEQILLQVRR